MKRMSESSGAALSTLPRHLYHRAHRYRSQAPDAFIQALERSAILETVEPAPRGSGAAKGFEGLSGRTTEPKGTA